MIGNNRSTSIPTGGETKFHEHQAMVLWTGCRVESLVGFDHRFLCFERFFVVVLLFVCLVFAMVVPSFGDTRKSEHGLPLAHHVIVLFGILSYVSIKMIH